MGVFMLFEGLIWVLCMYTCTYLYNIVCRHKYFSVFLDLRLIGTVNYQTRLFAPSPFGYKSEDSCIKLVLLFFLFFFSVMTDHLVSLTKATPAELSHTLPDSYVNDTSVCLLYYYVHTCNIHLTKGCCDESEYMPNGQTFFQY